MSKPFLIINVVDGKVGNIKERATWDEAVETATAMAKEQCDVPEDDIRKEIEEDSNFYQKGGGFEVVIAQTDDD